MYELPDILRLRLACEFASALFSENVACTFSYYLARFCDLYGHEWAVSFDSYAEIIVKSLYITEKTIWLF